MRHFERAWVRIPQLSYTADPDLRQFLVMSVSLRIMNFHASNRVFPHGLEARTLRLEAVCSNHCFSRPKYEYLERFEHPTSRLMSGFCAN